MRKLLLAALLASGCGAGLLDHAGVQLPGGGGCQLGESAQSCGPTCKVCEAPDHGTAVCVNHACGVQCDAGRIPCEDGCCGASSLAAGGSTTCAVAGGAVRCWGSNDAAQLGADAPAQSATPVEVSGTQGASVVVVGASHVCAIVGGPVKCWGANDDGQLGPGVASSQSATPVTVQGVAGALALVAGDRHTCARTAAGIVCWGANVSGQLGDAATVHGPGSPIPGTGSLLAVQTRPDVATLSGVQALAIGADHGCALLADGTVACWGKNDRGQAGNGIGGSVAQPALIR